ncbi:hypothetical protein [Magnetovibrio blakemorei]|nr:hypothetical protein [Magnetovibrio blakemorei]
MLTRMLMHSAIFTVVVALGAVSMNSVGMLDGGKPAKSSFSSFFTGSAAGGGHQWNRREHDDD